METSTRLLRSPSTFYDWMMSKGDSRTMDWSLCGSPLPLLLIVFTYVVMVKVLVPHWMAHRKPFRFTLILKLYNAAVVVLSAGFFIAIGKVSYFKTNFNWICEPVDYGNDPESLAVPKIAWWFLLLKFTEFADTIFILLRRNHAQLSNLHVIHHSLVPCNVWLVLKYGAGGSNIFYAFVNSFVHVVMYSYYFIAAFGPSMKKYLWWKKYLTILQMAQFALVFAQALLPLIYDCGFPPGFCYVIMANAALFLCLFANFYRHSYLLKEETTASATSRGPKKEVEPITGEMDKLLRKTLWRDETELKEQDFQAAKILFPSTDHFGFHKRI